MLPRPYRIRGMVVHGSNRGNRLGFPTANLQGIDTLLPGEGIYAGRAWVDGSPHAAALSIGPNPTFDEQTLKVEAFLLDFQGDIYGRPIEVDFLARLRNIVRFASADALIAQMSQDVEDRASHSRPIPGLDMIDWPRFAELVHSHQRFVLTCHVRPDSDAVGSEMGMAGILEQLGKDVLIVNDFAVPPNLRFLDPQHKLKQLGVDIQAAELADREVLHGAGHHGVGAVGRNGRRDAPVQGAQDGGGSSRQRGRLGGRAFQGLRSRGHRPAGDRGGRRLGRGADAGDRRSRCLPPWPPIPAGSALPRPRP